MGFLDRLQAAGRALIRPAPSPTATGGQAGTPKDASPVQRVIATGHGPQYPISDHTNELGHNLGWTFPAMRAIGRQYAQASVVVTDGSAARGKALAGWLTKSAAADRPGDERTPLADHPIAKLMRRPNPMKSGHEWRYQIAQQVALTGGAVIWEIRNLLGRPMELWVLPRGWLHYQLPSEMFPLGTWRVYPTRVAAGLWSGGLSGHFSSGFYIDVRETIIFGWPDALVPGEYTSPMAACSRIIDIAEQADEATWTALVRSPRPGMILSVDTDTPLTDQQIEQIKEQVQDKHGGSDKAGGTLVLQRVRKEDLGTPMSELNSVEVRNQALEQTLLVHGVPTLVIGKLDGATYSGNAAAVNAWVELGVQPDLSLLGGVLTHRWMPIFGDDFAVEFEAKRYDDPTIDLQWAGAFKEGYAAGYVTGNEVRAKLKLPPRPDLDDLKAPEPAPGAQPGQPGAAPAPADAGGGDDEFSLGLDDLTGDSGGGDDGGFDLGLGDDTTTGTPDPGKAGMPRVGGWSRKSLKAIHVNGTWTH